MTSNEAIIQEIELTRIRARALADMAELALELSDIRVERLQEGFESEAQKIHEAIAFLELIWPPNK